MRFKMIALKKKEGIQDCMNMHIPIYTSLMYTIPVHVIHA